MRGFANAALFKNSPQSILCRMSDSSKNSSGVLADRWAVFGSLCLLAAILILALPQFLRMPLTNDPIYYDLQANNLRDGGVLYRDMLEPNLPGVVWLHLGVRSALGKSSEAIRFADFAIFAGSVLTLCLAIRRAGGQLPTTILAACGIFWCYLSLAEWSHCQRDPWMLLPAGIAMSLRERQVARLRSSGRKRSVFLFGLLEGAVWAAGFWIKPHIIIPAAMVWFVSEWFSKSFRLWLIDRASLFTGGAIVGLLGSVWLIRTGAWPYFWDTLLHWNPVYIAGVRRAWSFRFFCNMCLRFLPWVFLLWAMIPVALVWLARAMRRDLPPPSERPLQCNNDERRALWAALFIGWILQAAFLQILFDYVHVPNLIMAIALFAMWYEKRPSIALRWSTVVVASLALLFSPLALPSRLHLWPRCIMEASGPELRNQLCRIPAEPDWEDLEQVAQFLETKDVESGDVVCHNNHLIYLYQRLGIKPTIRFVYQASYQDFLRTRLKEINADFLKHPPRYIISDLHGGDLSDAQARSPGPQGPLSLPAEFPAEARRLYPWRYPIVFRAGALLVHEYPGRKSAEE